MGKVAFVFPGQGSQAVGMGLDFFENFEEAAEVFNKFDSVLNRENSKLCFYGPEEELKNTANTQPALLSVSLAILAVIKNRTNLKADYLAGHSLGEYAALCEAGVLSLEDTIKIIAKRGELMSQASSDGAMSAILGLSQGKIEECIKSIESEGNIGIANYNTPEQIVITGDKALVEKLGELCKEAGAKRVIPLAVSGAFHSVLMKDASVKFEEFVSNFEVNNASVPVYTNVDARACVDGAEFREKMPRQIYSSVYWTQTIQNLEEAGVDTFIEVGSGKVLAGLIKKISKNAKVYNIFDIASFNKIIEELQSITV